MQSSRPQISNYVSVPNTNNYWQGGSMQNINNASYYIPKNNYLGNIASSNNNRNYNINQTQISSSPRGDCPVGYGYYGTFSSRPR